jgi:hypothetical protein
MMFEIYIDPSELAEGGLCFASSQGLRGIGSGAQLQWSFTASAWKGNLRTADSLRAKHDSHTCLGLGY